VADPTRKRDALEILNRYRIAIPGAVRAWLEGPDDDRSLAEADRQVHIVVSPHESFRAARRGAEALGLQVLYLGDRIEGESRDVAKVHAGIAMEIAQYRQPVAPPCVILSGGETSVTVRGKGRGGRNVEFALAMAIALAGERKIHALAADTDGIDGMEPSSIRTAWTVQEPVVLIRLHFSKAMTRTASSKRWATSWSPVRPTPT
jgi:hydroxypyruvate reductase